jgi:hypothetical protein
MEPKVVRANFSIYWSLLQIAGAGAIALSFQGVASFWLNSHKIDNFLPICAICGCAYLLSNILQGYLQWFLLNYVVKTLDRKWIYTHAIGMPIQILTLLLVHIGLVKIGIDDGGMLLTALAIIGAVGGAASGFTIGKHQQQLLQIHLHLKERSLWVDWDRDRLLAGALGGMSNAICTVGLLFICGWDRANSIVYIPIVLASSFLTHQILYGVVIGDALTDLFKRSRLLQ